jgi:predicted ATPase
LTTGHGGQVLCSEATASLLRRDLDESVRLVDLGAWRLRDVQTPERLFQVDYPGMPEQAFPPLSAEAGQAAHLPMRFTRFFGRDDEITRLVEMLQPGQAADLPIRHVTLTGSGGTGKTRLALEVAERLAEPFKGAVWFAPLADLSDPRLIADTLLDSLHLARSPHREPLDQVVEELSRQPSVLVLDNFEHLVEKGSALVQALLSRVPTLKVLITSRQLLGLSGEQEFVIPPLDTPNGGETAEQLSMYESVQLFVDRAQTAMQHFQVTSGNAPAVAELCHRLEGIPLAIELAAARALVMTPGQMLRQLEQRFGFLVSRKRDVIERHKTLHAAIDWSYKLLTPELQRFFASLSVFRGGWTVDAAEAVCDQPMALDYLAQLRECSLVLVEETVASMRYRMLETLREYASEQLSLETQAILEQGHASYFVALAEEAEPELERMEQGNWLDRLENDHANLMVVLGRPVIDDRGAEASLRLAGALPSFWRRRGYTREGLEWFIRVLDKSPSILGSIRAKAQKGAGSLASAAGDMASSRVFHEHELAIRLEIGDKHGTANALGALAWLQGKEAPRSLFEQSLAIYQEIGDKQSMGGSLLGLGICAEATDDLKTARSFYEQALLAEREAANPQGVCNSLMCLSRLARFQGDLIEARRCAEERLSTCRACGRRTIEILSLRALHDLAFELGDEDTVLLILEECQTLLSKLWNHRERAFALEALGRMALRHGDYIQANNHLKESLMLMRNTGEPSHVAGILSYLAAVARALGDFIESRRLFEEEGEIRRLIGSPTEIACNLDSLGMLAQVEADYTMAQSCYAQSLAIRLDNGTLRAIEQSVMNFAGLAMDQRHPKRAALLWGAAESIRTSLGLVILPSEQKKYESNLVAARDALGEEVFGGALLEGRGLTVEQSVAYALQEEPV